MARRKGGGTDRRPEGNVTNRVIWVLSLERLAARMADVPNDLHHIAEDVVRAVSKGTPLRANVAEGRRTVAVLEAIYQSGHEGRPVKMSEVV